MSDNRTGCLTLPRINRDGTMETRDQPDDITQVTLQSMGAHENGPGEPGP